ncbi:MAG: phosphoglycerate dehydrogenase, partial [Methanomicrobia archaeon]|nr:phosphoglycerate dehydrogenase [Methanomicrobia archaeon]
IGAHVAKIGNGFDMKSIAYDVIINEELAKKYGVVYKTLDEVLRESDIITLHVPLLPQTKHMIGEEQFKMMKKTAILVNASRGGTIDEKTLYNALKNNDIYGACLDVFENEPPFDSPLLKLENTVFTQHLGANTNEAQTKAGIIIAEEIMKIL